MLPKLKKLASARTSSNFHFADRLIRRLRENSLANAGERNHFKFNINNILFIDLMLLILRNLSACFCLVSVNQDEYWAKQLKLCFRKKDFSIRLSQILHLILFMIRHIFGNFWKTSNRTKSSMCRALNLRIVNIIFQ